MENNLNPDYFYRNNPHRLNLDNDLLGQSNYSPNEAPIMEDQLNQFDSAKQEIIHRLDYYDTLNPEALSDEDLRGYSALIDELRRVNMEELAAKLADDELEVIENWEEVPEILNKHFRKSRSRHNERLKDLDRWSEFTKVMVGFVSLICIFVFLYLTLK